MYNSNMYLKKYVVKGQLLQYLALAFLAPRNIFELNELMQNNNF